jgi:cytidylate kinase
MAVVTISRQYGSGGTEVAAQVCQLLGYQYLDKELIARAASETGLGKGEVVRFTEQHSKWRSFLDRLLFPGPYVVAQVAMRDRDASGAETLIVEELDKAECLDLIQTVIHAEYREGDAVIVGRGGQAVLQNLPGTLHVRVIAPMKDRILRIQQQEGLDLEQAHKLATQNDRKTADYLEEVFDIDVDNPNLYHLMINTGKVGIDQAASLIAHVVREMAA